MNVHLLRRTFRPDRHGDQLAHEPEPSGELRDPPPGLTDSQRALWWQTITSAPPGVLFECDARAVLAFVIHADAVEQCRQRLAADGLLIETAQGIREHPASRALARHAALMQRAAVELGFTPASRPKVRTATPKASPNPFDDD